VSDDRDLERIHGDPSIELVLEVAEATARDVVADVGCGGGVLSFALAPAVSSIAAVDDRREAIDEARRLAVEVGVDNVAFSAVNLYALPFSSESFTLAVSRNAIHRFREPVAALKEMARSLTPAGRVVVYDTVVTPDVDRYLNELARLADATHRRHCSRDEFFYQFENAGLKVEVERQDRRTVDLAYWLEAAAVDSDRAELIRRRLQELSLKVQTAIDLAVSDRLVSFSYDVVCFRLTHA
jgi:SAM-dependent methyltransferase